MNKIKSFITLSICIVVMWGANLFAGWMRTYGGSNVEFGGPIVPTSDGYVVIGTTYSFGLGKGDVWLLKINQNGDTMWTRTYGGAMDDWQCGVDTTPDGGYILACGTEVDTNDWDIELIKTDSDGNAEWTKTYPNEGYDCAWTVRTTSDSGYIVAGYGNGEMSDEGILTYSNIWIIKTDKDGNLSWSSSFGEEGHVNQSFWIEQTSDGGYIVALGSYLHQESWQLLKLDSNGDSLWMKHYNDGCCEFVQQTSDGGFIATGAYAGNVTLTKTKNDGEAQWSRTFSKQYNDCGYCVRESSDGGYIICCMWGHKCENGVCTPGATWLIKTDVDGNITWERTFGELGRNDYCFYVIQVPDGGYILTGCTTTFGNGSSDLWLIKTDSLGYVCVEDPVTPPVTLATHQFEIVSPIGSEILLKYTDSPLGFHASVYDASGRKVDEISSPNQNGVLIWGPQHNPGVYFIVPERLNPKLAKVILVR